MSQDQRLGEEFGVRPVSSRKASTFHYQVHTSSDLWGFPHTKQFSHTRSHKWKAQSYKTTLPPVQTPVTSPGCHLFWLRDHTLEVPTTPSLGSIYLLEQLTQLREHFYLLVSHQFILKGYSQEQSVEETPRARCGKGQGASRPSESRHWPSSSTCSPAWEHSEPWPIGFLGGLSS